LVHRDFEETPLPPSLVDISLSFPNQLPKPQKSIDDDYTNLPPKKKRQTENPGNPGNPIEINLRK
jgi:hypothetical protein